MCYFFSVWSAKKEQKIPDSGVIFNKTHFIKSKIEIHFDANTSRTECGTLHTNWNQTKTFSYFSVFLLLIFFFFFGLCVHKFKRSTYFFTAFSSSIKRPSFTYALTVDFYAKNYFFHSCPFLITQKKTDLNHFTRSKWKQKITNFKNRNNYRCILRRWK